MPALDEHFPEAGGLAAAFVHKIDPRYRGHLADVYPDYCGAFDAIGAPDGKLDGRRERVQVHV